MVEYCWNVLNESSIVKYKNTFMIKITFCVKKGTVYINQEIWWINIIIQ